jgi:hypothetical protein
MLYIVSCAYVTVKFITFVNDVFIIYKHLMAGKKLAFLTL